MSLPLYTLSSQTNAGSDYCNTENEEDIFFLQDELTRCAPPWADSHSPRTVFLSSVDLHIHCSYQMVVPGSPATVCLLPQVQGKKLSKPTDHRQQQQNITVKSHTPWWLSQIRANLLRATNPNRFTIGLGLKLSRKIWKLFQRRQKGAMGEKDWFFFFFVICLETNHWIYF